ncbi:hypothetical protein WS69_04500 [Burkholderia sp. BDU5]|nr:hypothetical protein WS69_04500 [Burkholderia sp. BDU5]
MAARATMRPEHRAADVRRASARDIRRAAQMRKGRDGCVDRPIARTHRAPGAPGGTPRAAPVHAYFGAFIIRST